MNGIERLENQVLEMNDYNISTIFEFLKTRTDLYENFNNEEKSIKEMYEFIYNKARKLKKNNVAMVSDKVVYLWAITYFSKTNEELGLNKKEKPTKQVTEPQEKVIKQDKPEEKKNEEAQISLFQEVA